MSKSENNFTPTLDMIESELAREQHRRSRIIAIFAIVSVVLSLSVAYALRQGGLAFTREVQVLDCTYEGEAAHIHDEYCYDEYGDLVCTMPEHELHVHTEDCYDEEGNLICGEDAYTHEHVHGPGCFVTVTVEEDDPEYEMDEEYGDEYYDEDYDEYYEDEASDPATLGDPVDDMEYEDEAITETEEVEEEVAKPSQSFKTELRDEEDNPIIGVQVEAPEGALPEGATMKVDLTTTDEIEETVYDAVYSETTGRILAVQAIDITFYDGVGERIKPEKPLSVKLTSDLITGGEANMVVHVDDDGNAEIITVLDEEEIVEREVVVEEDELVFESEEF